MLTSLKAEHNITGELSINKVIVDENFESDTKNEYPTIIGMLGTVTTQKP